MATARRLQDEFGLRFPLVHGDAERVPLTAACADLVISEYASVWCDPYRWILEGARLLRPGGRLVFMAESTLARMCLIEVQVPRAPPTPTFRSFRTSGSDAGPPRRSGSPGAADRPTRHSNLEVRAPWVGGSVSGFPEHYRD